MTEQEAYVVCQTVYGTRPKMEKCHQLLTTDLAQAESTAKWQTARGYPSQVLKVYVRFAEA